MPGPPPSLAQAALIGPTTRIIRRVDIYEEDATTPFMLDAPFIDGSISVDGARDERRTMDMLFDNTDGELDNYPEGFWYDKVIKPYRGLEWEGLTPSALRFSTDPLYSLDLPGAVGDYASTPWLGSNPKALALPGTAGHYASVKPYGGPNGLVLAGTAGSYASTPDHTSLDITGDLDLRCRLVVADWSTAAHRTLVAKWGAVNGDKSYGLFLANDTLRFYLRDAVNESGSIATAPIPISDGETGWVRVTFRASDQRVQFFYSLAVDPDIPDWTQIGTDLTHARTGAQVTSQEVTIGASGTSGTSNLLAGVVYRAQIRTGIDGTPVLDVDFTDGAHGWEGWDTSGATGIDATGKTVTISGAVRVKGDLAPEGLFTPGSIGHGAWAPDSADLDLVGDMEIITCVRPIFTGGSAALINKEGAWALRINNTSWGLQFIRWGSVMVNRVSTVTAITAGAVQHEDLWIRVLHDVDDGSGQYLIQFFISLQPASTAREDLTWTQVGADITGATAVPDASTGVAAIAVQGATVGSGLGLAGGMSSMTVLDGIGGTPVLDVDFSNPNQGWRAGDSNAALGLDSTGKVVTLNGAGSRILGSLDPVSELDITLYDVTLTDWTPASALGTTLVARYGTTSTERSVWFRILSGGQPHLTLSAEGSVAVSADSALSLGAPDGSLVPGLRVTWRASDGRVQFFRYDGTNWTQHGTDKTLAVTRIHPSTSPWGIGARLLPEAENLAGVIGRVVMSDKIDGTPVLDVDFSDANQWAVGDSDGATGVEAAAGRLVTIHGASSVIRSKLDVTQDIDVRTYDVAADDWTAAPLGTIAARWHASGPNRSWWLRVTNDELQLLVSFDGSAGSSVVRSLTAPVDGQPLSFRFTRVTSTGVTKLFQLVGGIWTQLGADAVLGAGQSLWHTNNGVDVFVGTRTGGGGAPLDPFAGTIGRVEIRDGIDGEVVASPDFDQPSLVGQTAFSDEQGNDWTVNGAASIIDTGHDPIGGAHLRTADSPAHVISGGVLNLRTRFAADDWTPASVQTVVSKWSTANNQRAWKLELLTDGKLQVGLSTNGTNELLLTSDVAVPFTNGQPAYFGVNVEINDGAGGKKATFLTSADGAIWNELGTPQSSATLGTAALHVSTEPIRIGATAEGFYLLGTLYEFLIADGARTITDLDFTGLEADTHAMQDANGVGYQFLGQGLTVLGGLFESQTWEVQLGEFLLDRIDSDNFPHTVAVTGRDRAKALMEVEFTEATTFQETDAPEEVIRAIATAGNVNRMVMPFTGQTLGRDYTFEAGTKRWEAIKQIALAFNYEVFFDNTGYLVMQPQQDPVSSAVVHTFETGEFGNLVKWSKSSSDTLIKNQVVVRGEATDVLPVSFVAENHEPSSPTSIENLNRIKTHPITSSFITTEAQAQALAESLLKVMALEAFDVNITSLVFPWLEAHQIVEFLDPNPNPGDPTRYLLSSMTIPMSLAAMTAVARRVTLVG